MAPKLFKAKRYVICPYIDMAYHVGVQAKGNVAFEYFTNGYSLVSKQDGTMSNAQKVRISYGERSNDILLQNYDFVEPDNPRDIYVMPSLRERDISSMKNGMRTVRLWAILSLITRKVYITHKEYCDTVI